MRRTRFLRVLSLVLCALLCIGSMTVGAEAGMMGPSGSIGQTFDEATISAVLNRSMDQWTFPLEEKHMADVVDFCGCLGTGTNAAFYSMPNYSCTTAEHGQTSHGNVSLDFKVSAWEEVYAPFDGVMYRASYPDFISGYTMFVEHKLGDGYSYYAVLSGVSENIPVASGTQVKAGDFLGHTYDPVFKFSAVMAESGKGESLAAYPTQNLMPIWDCGWLTESRGVGMICVNSSYWTSTQYNNLLSSSYPGPVIYKFVARQPSIVEDNNTLPIPEEPTFNIHTEHTWNAGVTTLWPTHTTEGSIVYTCTVCGETQTSAVPTLPDHTYDQALPYDWYLCTPATCTAAATYYYSCLCGATGYRIFTNGTPKNHSWNSGDVQYPATHVSDGEMIYVCTVCGDTKVERIPATGNHVYDQAIAASQYRRSGATCTQAATYFYSCTCGAIGWNYFTYGSPSNHSWNSGRVITAATHTSTGTIRYTCNVCGATKDEPIPAASEHTFNQSVVSAAYLVSPATCESAAKYAYSCICGAKGTQTFTSGNLADHTWNEGTVSTAPTHTRSGILLLTCTTCGKTSRQTIPATQFHSFTECVASEAYLKTAATCCSPAVYYRSCVCGARGFTTFSYGVPVGHTYSPDWSIDECHHWRAAICGHNEEYTDLAFHKWGLGTYTVMPGLRTPGEMVYTCSICGAQKTEVVPAQLSSAAK